jgi:hypothetical protein
MKSWSGVHGLGAATMLDSRFWILDKIPNALADPMKVDGKWHHGKDDRYGYGEYYTDE